MSRPIEERLNAALGAAAELDRLAAGVIDAEGLELTSAEEDALIAAGDRMYAGWSREAPGARVALGGAVSAQYAVLHCLIKPAEARILAAELRRYVAAETAGRTE